MAANADPTWRPLVVAHRGLWYLGQPENSLEAFREARDAGFPSECDVQRSSDGEPVVVHDEVLDRTTAGNGTVDSYPLAELRKMHLRCHTRDIFLPALTDVAGLVYLVEVKPPNARELVRRVIEIMAGRRWLLQSFDASNVAYAREQAPGLAVALLGEDLNAVDVAIENRWPAYLSHDIVDGNVAQRLREAGLPLGVWTVNAEQLPRMMPWQPSVIISDEPILVRGTLQRSGIQSAGHGGVV